MPLDTGSSTHMLRLVDTAGRAVGPIPANYDDLGAYLKAVREHRELSLVDLARETRVRRTHLAAIEAGERAPLPSRPFAIGYVRSYARALGLDGEVAVSRYKAEWPEAIERLQNPVGVTPARSGSRVLVYALAGVVVAAVGLWNVAQRTLVRDEPRSLDLPGAVAAAPVLDAPIRLSPISEAPAESTVPAPYVTPGLAAPPPVVAAADAPAPASAPAPKSRFTPKGEVYGVPPAAATVVLQADRSVSLVVHGPDGVIYFARELEPGQAYRAPTGRGLVAALGDPAAISVYVGGGAAQPVQAEPIAIDKLEPPHPAAPTTAAGVAPSIVSHQLPQKASSPSRPVSAPSGGGGRDADGGGRSQTRAKD